jgi:ATP-binding cassette subfamily F protein uup
LENPKEEKEEQSKTSIQNNTQNNSEPASQSKKKLSYKEQRELEQLTDEIEVLSKQKQVLEQKLQEQVSDHAALLQLTQDYELIKQKLDEKELRWLELTE